MTDYTVSGTIRIDPPLDRQQQDDALENLELLWFEYLAVTDQVIWFKGDEVVYTDRFDGVAALAAEVQDLIYTYPGHVFGGALDIVDGTTLVCRIELEGPADDQVAIVRQATNV